MRDNNEAIVETLCSMPFVGALLDREPYPIGEVTAVRELNIEAKQITVRLQHRATSDIEERECVVLYLGGQPVLIAPAAKEDDDGG